MKPSQGLTQLLQAIEWMMTGLLTLAGGLELWQSPWLGITQLGLAILLCPKTPLHWTTKAILTVFALISTFI